MCLVVRVLICVCCVCRCTRSHNEYSEVHGDEPASFSGQPNGVNYRLVFDCSPTHAVPRSSSPAGLRRALCARRVPPRGTSFAALPRYDPRAPRSSILRFRLVSLIYHTTRPTRRVVVALQYPTWCAAGASSYGRALLRLPQWTANVSNTFSRSAVTSTTFRILKYIVHFQPHPISPTLIPTPKWRRREIHPSHKAEAPLASAVRHVRLHPTVREKAEGVDLGFPNHPPPSGRRPRDARQLTNDRNTESGFKIQPATVPDFRKLSALLATLKIAYHIYSLKEERESRVDLRGVPKELPIEEVKEDFLAHDLPVQSHARCVKGPGDHGTTACTRNKDIDGPPACVICKSSGHTASYLGCPQVFTRKTNMSNNNNIKKKTPPVQAALRRAPVRVVSDNLSYANLSYGETP
ncbi:hypothetical protein EVAR_4097_1 [Eumeta japonica]|uniref:Nucleic-acid-binding protein from transposon X-element n=1 Tax=Eumeta variegata TaxID=151549 RepID=A0A4C1T3Z6_EUMVA|nr:hypothetical protein EVAR_4097_1 [Eumeta japonica]